VRRIVGLCPQEIVIWESLTCLEQLIFVGTQYDLPRTVARSRAKELLDILGLSEKSRRLAKTLSGGMKRRMNLALALVHDPEILILDEPQAGLDPQSRILVREYIRSLANRKTVLLTTHEMDEADRLSDRVGIIDQGRMLILDSPAGLKGSLGGGEILEIRPSVGDSDVPEDAMAEATRAVLDGPAGADLTLERFRDTLRFSGDGLQDRIPDIQRHLREAGFEVHDLRVRKPTLEDVFISLTGRELRE
jgi:ABC-2 type transport system ATP-binding protein